VITSWVIHSEFSEFTSAGALLQAKHYRGGVVSPPLHLIPLVETPEHQQKGGIIFCSRKQEPKDFLAQLSNAVLEIKALSEILYNCLRER